MYSRFRSLQVLVVVRLADNRKGRHQPRRRCRIPCGGDGILHILTKDAQATRRALESASFKISTEQQVVVIDVEDKPGTSASLYRRLADANVNVNLTYVSDNIQKVKERHAA